ncbi:MAG: UDP-N-acetylmuramate dehydrogenase [Pseudomonadota bacterium]
MHPDLAIEHDFPLQRHNSFGIAARARSYVRLHTPAQLQAVLADPALAAMPRLVLGGGSNIVLQSDFAGLVLHIAMAGKTIVGTDADFVYVRAAAGESWHGLVSWTLEQGLGGLENLALIPGTVGASPIQNIGAYGVELQDCFHSVQVFDSASGRTFEMDRAACRFGYRDSVFKHPAGRALIVLAVTLALPKRWRANLRYGELAQALAEQGDAPDPSRVAEAVMAIRRRKLPDPAVIGNAGSFFKNPLVTREQCAALLERYPDLVHHAQPDGGEKLAAGWLIDQCGWKGRALGPAGVYPKQALVLVNLGGASGADIMRLAAAIAHDVAARFGVRLEPEPVLV